MRSTARHIINDAKDIRPFIAVALPLEMVFTSIEFACSFAAFEHMPTSTMKWLMRSSATRTNKNGTQCTDILAWAYWPIYQQRTGSFPKDDSVFAPCLPLDADEMCRRVGICLSWLEADADVLSVTHSAKWNSTNPSTLMQVIHQYQNPNFYAARILQWASHYRALRYEQVIPKLFWKATVPFTPMTGNIMVPKENKHAI